MTNRIIFEKLKLGDVLERRVPQPGGYNKGCVCCGQTLGFCPGRWDEHGVAIRPLPHVGPDWMWLYPRDLRADWVLSGDPPCEYCSKQEFPNADAAGE